MDKAVQFGPQNILTGILSEPEQAAADRPTVVVLNTNVMHRVGANRLYPPLARELADLGVPVLRYDLSGIGDSDVRPGEMTPYELVKADVKDALDFLEKETSSKKFVLMGLCAGANLAIICSSHDDRVVGTVLMDPTIPQTPRFYRERAKRIVRQLFSPAIFHMRARIRAYLVERRQRQEKPVVAVAASQVDPEAVSTFFGEIYAKSAARDVKMLAVFTAGMQLYHNYREQILDAWPNIPLGKLMTLEYFSGSDHYFTRQSDRDRLHVLIKDWIKNTDFAQPKSAAL
ncbi:MAG TPA: alpha/beta fold hydrolase [Xanthobacteraceae bacterium]|nr:alpha/beta fold hydrolase [Xanthobacteraceae bacterium]